MLFFHHGGATNVARCVGLIFFFWVFLRLFTAANPQVPNTGAQLNGPVSFASPGGVQEGWVARYDGPATRIRYCDHD
jgi:hypothetical protein